MAKAQLTIERLNQHATLNVRIRITRQMKARIFFAGLAMRLAAGILGCGIEIKGAK